MKSRKTWEHKQLQNLMLTLSTGMEAKVRVTKNTIYGVSCGKFWFTISSLFGLNIRKGGVVTFQFHLTDTRHPNCYVQRAQARDPASRLAVSLRGCDIHGLFHVWLMTNGKCNVMKMNSLVDILEGYSLEESRSFERRWHVKAMKPCDKSSRKHVYT
ncbi:hypothetical protein BDW59DRAFT_146039 [Aspergillus cavernicola]|uniref:Uncharacterized protein n=1 Tax=Aspergillus cavernicola TaxID=176166 RepID=A0ABR4ICX5_9EURO